MTRTLCRPFVLLGPVVFLIVLATIPAAPVTGQSGGRQSPAGEWRSYGADLANTRYSPLDQINAENFSKLEVAWRFKTDNLGPTIDAARLHLVRLRSCCTPTASRRLRRRAQRPRGATRPSST